MTALGPLAALHSNVCGENVNDGFLGESGLSGAIYSDTVFTVRSVQLQESWIHFRTLFSRYL